MVGYVICGALIAAVAALAACLARQRRRLRRLAAAMEDCLAQRGTPMAFSLREDAVAPVENAAAEMANRIATLEERCRLEARRTSGLTADISHQLKTPLASLRLFCEMDAGAHLAQQLGQIERMEGLIGSLLRLEKLCADGYAFTFEELDVRPVAQQAWDALRPLWPEKRFTLAGDAVIRCDGRWLAEALGNLLKNACEHTAPDGHITLRMERTEHAFHCTVEDDGGGVALKDLPHLFERFYRAEGGAGQGAGLGLAIAREIVHRHHGHISAENTGAGLRIAIDMPILHLTKV